MADLFEILGIDQDYDAISGMFFEAFLIYRTLLHNPELAFDQAKKFYETYRRYRNKHKLYIDK